MSSTQDFISGVQEGSIDLSDHYGKVVDELQKINAEKKYFAEFNEEYILDQLKEKKSGKLAGLPISVKDCICVNNLQTRGGSRILSGYKPPFDATAVAHARREGAIIIGKTIQDEFGFGGFSVNVGKDFSIPLNPFDVTRSCGGSSGGSAGLTQDVSFSHISLGESTGGSIVNPASFCGVIGLCPTYGRVSRYGLLDYGSSLDKIGPLSKNVEDAALMLEVISGYDNNESTSLKENVPSFTKKVGSDVKKMRIGVISESLGDGIDEGVSKTVWETISRYESLGVEVETISLPLTTKYGIPSYYLIATSEASANLAKYCGMRYGAEEKLEGTFNDYFSAVRSEHLGKEAKRRIILGTFARMAGYRDAYYLKAMKVRTKIINEYKGMFKKFDALLSPTVPTVAPKFEDIEKMSVLQHYLFDQLTVGPNLAGLPHINVPCGFSQDMPVGLMLSANHLKEENLIALGSAIE